MNPKPGTYTMPLSGAADLTNDTIAERLAEWLEAFADLDAMPLTDLDPISASGGGWSAEIVDYPTPTSATVAVTYIPEDEG